MSWTLGSLPDGLTSRRVALLSFDVVDREVNVMTAENLAELDARLDELVSGDHEAVVVVSGKPGAFIAGADVEAIRAVTSEAEGTEASAAGQRVLRRLATLGMPSVAAVDGACVGGGTELALWCTARVATRSERTRIGLPEVKLGIVPGFGGTQRLPPLVGLARAIELVTTGRLLGARQAKTAGLVDEVVHPEHLLAAAARRAEREIAGEAPGRRRPKDTYPGVRDLVAKLAGRKVEEQAGARYPAPMEAVRLCRLSLDEDLDFGLRQEAEALGRLVVTPTCRNLLHVHALTRRAGRGGEAPQEGALLGVVGAGVMGAGLAAVAASAGYRVRVQDVAAKAFGPAIGVITKALDRRARRSARPPVARRQALDRLSFSTKPAGMRSADLVVEAVVERAEVKDAVLRSLEDVVSKDALIATNTSSLSVDAMAAALRLPGRFGGLHFFNPVPKMPLVEVVPGAKTSARTVERLRGWAHALGKHPVVVRDSPGFLVNRLLMPYLAEALALHDEGVSISSIDAAAKSFGMPMGPFRLLDEVGLDVAQHVQRTFAESFPGRFEEHPTVARLVREERLGAKVGKGFYDHPERRGAKPTPWSGLPTSGRELSEDAITDRLFLRMADEAMRVLDEGLVDSEEDVDLGTVFGIGFPPFRGGLMRWVEEEGRDSLHRRLTALAERHGGRFEPSPRWGRRAR